MSVRSMTGFARERATIGAFEVAISVKSVNHRGLDLHFYTGSELDPFETAMRSAVKRFVRRGHLDIRAQLTRPGSVGALAVDTAKLDAYGLAWREAAERLGAEGSPDVDAALRVPGVLSESSAAELTPDFEAPLVALLEKALTALNRFREREGAEITAILEARARALASAADEIDELRRNALPAFQARLRERLSELLDGSGIDPQRLVQEAALLADRSDVGEEIERLRIHSGQLEDILRGGDEVGKKLDFLLQEMNRETNTILSKTNGLGGAALRITELAVAAKSDIEKVREQALNLE